jgi:F0F1-type ATP synthase delta subunit
MEKTYAQALWNMVESGTKPKEAVAKLHQTLAAARRENLLPRIARAFGRIAERQMRRREIVLSVARVKDEHRARRDVEVILKELKARAFDLTIKIDDTLIGGWRLEGRERLHDMSFKKYLLEMYNRTIQS